MGSKLYRSFKDSLKARGVPKTLVKSAFFPVKAAARRFDHIKKVRANSASCGPLKLTCLEGHAKLYWNGVEITKDVGLNTSMCVNGRWHNSFQARWLVEVPTPDRIVVNNQWYNLPIVQRWQLIIQDRKINWQVWQRVEEKMVIDERKAGVIVSGEYRRWFNSYEEDAFPGIRGWEDMPLVNMRSRLMGVKGRRTGKAYLPAILFDFSAAEDRFEPQVQNSSRQLNGRIVQARVREDGEGRELSPGEYGYFSGTLRIIDDDREVDAIVEEMRRELVEQFFT